MSGTPVVLAGGQPVWNVAAVAPTPEILAMLGSKSYHVLASGAAASTLVVLIAGARFRRREDEESRTPRRARQREDAPAREEPGHGP